MFEVSGRNSSGARCPRFQNAINLEQDVRGFRTQFACSKMFEVSGRNLPGARCSRFQDEIYLERDVRGLRDKHQL